MEKTGFLLIGDLREKEKANQYAIRKNLFSLILPERIPEQPVLINL